jgi:hypothetical protein
VLFFVVLYLKFLRVENENKNGLFTIWLIKNGGDMKKIEGLQVETKKGMDWNWLGIVWALLLGGILPSSSLEDTIKNIGGCCSGAILLYCIIKITRKIRC